MKLTNWIYIIIIILLCSCGKQYGLSLKALEEWSKNPIQPLENKMIPEKALTQHEATQITELFIAGWKARIAADKHRNWAQKRIIHDSLEMPFEYRVFGLKPTDGRSLYISMHGGGNAPAKLNDQQWYNQTRLYEPAEGIYIAPRAPWNDWNMWFKPGMDEFFEDLIQTTVALMDVNPDKVYLLGYSAGGDGVWRMAPRMADRWAAASMMAGHPGEASQVNLLNVPFMIWMGELDGAYNRNRLAKEKGQVLDSLREENPRGYIHATHIISGKGHWMERADTTAISWMAEYKRNPFPEKVVWRQEEVTRPSLYWLEVPQQSARPGMEVIVEHKGNTFTILKNDYDQFTIGLNDDMVDFDKPIEIVYDGKRLFNGKVERSAKDVYQSIEQRRDTRLLFSARLTIYNNEQVK